MGKIFLYYGKKSSERYDLQLFEDSQLELSRIVLYTTRPMREGTGRPGVPFTDERLF